ncbi:hypothetical protein [Bradyrhizobium genosp. P]|uniref:hypothetical protein n=1 Tax=Bradyrhizobium genosp. P TaxID=83641 RepID=UPI003CEBE744
MTEHDNILIRMALREGGKIIGKYLQPEARDRTNDQSADCRAGYAGTSSGLRAGRQARRLVGISGRLNY